MLLKSLIKKSENVIFVKMIPKYTSVNASTNYKERNISLIYFRHFLFSFPDITDVTFLELTEDQN